MKSVIHQPPFPVPIGLMSCSEVIEENNKTFFFVQVRYLFPLVNLQDYHVVFPFMEDILTSKCSAQILCLVKILVINLTSENVMPSIVFTLIKITRLC